MTFHDFLFLQNDKGGKITRVRAVDSFSNPGVLLVVDCFFLYFFFFLKWSVHKTNEEIFKDVGAQFLIPLSPEKVRISQEEFEFSQIIWGTKCYYL